LLELLAEGWTQQQILANYPQLTPEDVQAAVRYALESVKLQRAFPLPM
jgi:uncharacterized protein (DUF433 family)